MHIPIPFCVALLCILSTPTGITLIGGRVMHYASINKEVSRATHQSGFPLIMISMQAIEIPYVMHKKGFIDMVKGLLAWLNKVLGVFKVFWSNSFVSNAIYRRKNNSEKIRQ